MNWLIKVFFTNDRSNTVIYIIIGQNCAQQLLFCLDGVRHSFGGLNFRDAGYWNAANFVHGVPVCPSAVLAFVLNVKGGAAQSGYLVDMFRLVGSIPYLGSKVNSDPRYGVFLKVFYWLLASHVGRLGRLRRL